jgi:hypothetical protein
MGLFRKALKLGQPSAEQMVDNLEFAANEEIRRIWEHLEGQAERQKEFEERLHSHEAQVAYLSACFHGLRTSDPQKHSRLALLTINCIFMDDLKPESLDDMMRAAIELTERDILELEKFVSRQSEILAEAEKSPMQWHDTVRAKWQSWGIEDHNAYSWRRTLSYFELCGSRARLAALGFIVAIRPKGTSNSPAEVPYVLLPEGKKFYGRIQELPPK